MTSTMQGLIASAVLLAALAPAQSAEPVSPTAASAPARVSGSVLFWTFEQQKSGYPHMEDQFPTRLVRRGTAVIPLPVAEK